ncbi:hypothetical protein K488DRAFT_84866 [Vararia minispora EC-137]|uniref:Uncharacterized protein n=1 Tax=Vararia minispora EC-137 TaxID=1314806 RepID=A0ACB8QPA2_9AGAM|nr:hypothetical protein K488DRAFT_84866 [Vararia minispora EC-137]
MLSRTIPRRVNALALTARRAYTVGRTEGSVAESKGFSKKEKAVEDQYARKHEQEQLAKLRKEIEKKKAELASLEQQAAETSSKSS